MFMIFQANVFSIEEYMYALIAPPQKKNENSQIKTKLNNICTSDCD